MLPVMKVTVSVPDDLWQAAHTKESAGPSDTVQRALRTLVERQRANDRPLANAPDQANLDRYSNLFEAAVESASEAIRSALDNGYRFGLLLAPGMGPNDFERLDKPEAVSAIQHLIFEWGDDWDLFSWEFSSHIESILTGMASGDATELGRLGDELLGEPDEPAAGVHWEKGERAEELPRITTTYAEGILAALRDVRDEATRRMRATSGQEVADE